MSYIAAAPTCTQPIGRPTREPLSERASLAAAVDFLDAALRLWDDDHAKAKTHIEIAAGILHDHGGGFVTDAQFPVVPIARQGLAPWQADKVREFIESSLESTIRLKDCASRAKLSTSHFSRAFRATFGMTAGHYIRRRRVERAQQKMLLSQETLSQIALACGFADQAHYSRVFRVVVGLSPNVWRRRNKTLAPRG